MPADLERLLAAGAEWPWRPSTTSARPIRSSHGSRRTPAPLGRDTFPSSSAEVRYFGPADGATVLPRVAGAAPMGMTPAADYYDEMPEPAAAPVTIIRPPRGWAPLDLREFTGAHELLYFLVLRNLKLRYKQTVLGAAWAVLQPLLTMAVFTVVFGRLARLGSDGLPYPVFALAALVPWTYFANALTQASTSLVDQHQLLTKVYFPRLLLPLAAVIAGLVDLAISFVLLLVVLAWYGITPSVRLLAVPGLRPAGGR